MNDEELARFRGLFVQTARQYLTSMGQIVSHLPTATPDELNELHISAHAVKGQSYAMNFQSMAHAAKDLEYVAKALLEQETELRDSQLEPTQALITRLSESVDEIEKTGHELDVAEADTGFRQVFSMVIFG